MTTVHGAYDVRIFHKEARALAARGFDVTLATTLDVRERRDGVTLLPLGHRDGPRWKRLGRDLRALAIMLARRDGVVHVHDPELLAVAAIAALGGARVIYDVHEFYRERIAASRWIPRCLRGSLAGLYGLIERLVLPHVAGVVVVSEAMLPSYVRALPRERVALVRNYPSIDPRAIDAARARPHPLGGRPYALHTGGAMRLRAFHDLVGAAERLRELGSPLAIVTLGPVRLEEYDDAAVLVRRARDAGVHTIGPVSYDETLAWLAHAEIGYLPLADTPNNRRGMPNKLFEYLLFGLPVVASRIGRVAEIVAAHDAGVLVPCDDGRAHGSALARLHDDRAERLHFADAARAAGASYSFDSECEALLRLYATIGAASA